VEQPSVVNLLRDPRQFIQLFLPVLGTGDRRGVDSPKSRSWPSSRRARRAPRRASHPLPRDLPGGVLQVAPGV